MLQRKDSSVSAEISALETCNTRTSFSSKEIHKLRERERKKVEFNIHDK
jgi:hypothetical protein